MTTMTMTTAIDSIAFMLALCLVGWCYVALHDHEHEEEEPREDDHLTFEEFYLDLCAYGGDDYTTNEAQCLYWVYRQRESKGVNV